MSTSNKPGIYALNETAVTLDLGNTISPEINNRISALAAQLEADPFQGFIECVPAYSALTVFFDPLAVTSSKNGDSSPFNRVKEQMLKRLERVETKQNSKKEVVEVPVNFKPEYGPDLGFVAEYNKLTTREVIALFTSSRYTVYMIGFLPGFAYMGKVNRAITTPRKKTPRTKVPKGSVGIAGDQTGIYPLDSPGGWQLIGKTEIELFTPNDKRPSLLAPGDEVRFIEM